MNNLKRVLSLGLAGTMLTGMMAIGASAADVSAFTDADEITHTEAVNVMSTLGVLKGKDTGAFDPTATVTRAEMAKIIAVMRNGGTDPTLGSASASLYTDVAADHWARGYIEYCSNLGIIAGRGDGTFGPEEPVSGAAAAKMLLVALGYDSDVFGFTGTDWELSVNREANAAGLYDEIRSIDTSMGLSRDNTAQMAYNALESNVMKISYGKNTDTGVVTNSYSLDPDNTFLNKYFGAYTFVGQMDGNSSFLNIADGSIQVTGDLDTADPTDVDYNTKVAVFPSDLDISNIGEEVKIIFKDGRGGTEGRPDKNDTIYGIFNTGATQVINATLADITNDGSVEAGKIEVDGVTYSVAKPSENDLLVMTDYITANNTTVGVGEDTVAHAKSVFEGLNPDGNTYTGNTVKFVCDSDGKINRAYVVTSTLSYVTAVTSTKVTINGLGTITTADHDVYDGIAVDDVVVYTKFYNSDKDKALITVTKAESVTGTMTGYKVYSTSPDLYTNVTLDGTTYKVNGRTLASATIGSNTAITSGLSSNSLNETYTIYLVNGYVGYLIQESTAANKLALVLESDGVLGSTFTTPRAQLLLADGTKTIVTLKDDSVIYKSNGTTKVTNDGQDSDIKTAGNLDVGTLVRYSVNSDGTYTVIEVVSGDPASTGYTLQQATNVGTSNTAAYDKDTKSVRTGNNTDAFTVTDGSAVLFVKQETTDGLGNVTATEYKVYNIRNLNTVKVADNGTVDSVKKDGKILAAYITLSDVRPSSTGTNTTVYGIVSASNGVAYVDGDSYQSFTVKNQSGSWTVLLPVGTSTLGGGKLVSFIPTNDNVYAVGDVTVYDGSSYDANHGLATWVKEYNSTDKTITYWDSMTQTGDPGDTSYFYTGSTATTKALDDDVVIAYVDANNQTGGDEVGISAFDSTTGYRNVLLIKDSSTEKVVAIIVESSLKANVNGTSLVVHANAHADWTSTGGTDTASFSITTSGVKLTATATVTWYNTDSTYTTAAATSNLTVPTTVSLVDGKGTLTVTEDGTTVAPGTYYFTVTVPKLSGGTDLKYEGVFTVTNNDG
jgi:hypothetical protein